MYTPGMPAGLNQKRIVVMGTGTQAGGRNITPFTIPQDARFIHILCVGSGGGGGAGFTAISGTAKGGGGGGGPGGCSGCTYKTSMLPKTLFLVPGLGGTGGATSGSAGNAGEASIVMFNPLAGSTVITQSNTLTYALGGNAGLAGTTSAGGNGGSGASATNWNTCSWGGSLNFSCASAGPAAWATGGAGGAPAGPSSGTSAPLRYLVTGGAGGGAVSTGNTESTGGGIVFTDALNISYNNSTTVVNPTAVRTNGAFGISNLDLSTIYTGSSFPYLGFGGSGGGGNSAGTGGRGGNGGIGSGGGGGAAGTTGGAGGDGGPGAIIIEWW